MKFAALASLIVAGLLSCSATFAGVVQKQTGTDNSTSYINSEVLTKKGEQEAREVAAERKVKAETDAKLVNYTGLLALFTFLLFCFTAALWWVTYRLSKDARNAGARQAAEMEKSLAISSAAANAAICGNDLNRKAFISSQRPWVVVHKIVPRSSIDLNHGLSFAIVVKNVGHSPAMNVDVSALVHLPHRGNAHEVHRNLRDEITRTRPAFISNDVSIGHLVIPGEEMEIQVQVGIELAEFQKAAARNPFGEIIILILGQVSYGFGIEGSEHESGFIFSVCRRGGAWIILDDGITPIDEVEIKRFSAGFYAT